MKRGNRRLNKTGQFYLIATVIIVVLIVGLATISNYSKSKSSARFYDLKEELEIESGYVLDYGVIKNKDIDILMENFTDNFGDYISEDIDLYFIFGEEGSLNGLKYKGGSKESISVSESGGKATLSIEDNEYEFDLKPGENFYFIIYQNIDGEKYVVTN